MKKPYFENKINAKTLIRGFSCNVDQIDLVWHRDHENRTITIIEGKGWQFQRDNDLPFTLKKGDKIKVLAREYHRIIKGDSDLIIKITKN